jgi:uncharacterized damage-inducible protein DinB
MQRPESNEYKPYFQSYIDLVEGGDFSELLLQNKLYTIAFFEGIPEEKHNYKYAEDKWTIKECLMHIIDTERVFSYRALACARGDKASLPNMDENLYARNVNVLNRTFKSLVEEFKAVRESSILLFKYMPDEKSKLIGHIGENAISARALGYLIIGHARHHLNVIKERYLF